MSSEEREQVLKMVEYGRISANEAMTLMKLARRMKRSFKRKQVKGPV